MTLRPLWLAMIAPRAAMLIGLLLLLIWAGEDSDVLLWLGLMVMVMVMVVSLTVEGVFRVTLRCPNCGHSPYVPAVFPQFPVIRQPFIPSPSCPNCGQDFE